MVANENSRHQAELFRTWMRLQNSSKGTPCAASALANAVAVLRNYVDRLLGGHPIDGLSGDLFTLTSIPTFTAAVRRIRTSEFFGFSQNGRPDHGNFEMATSWYLRFLEYQYKE